jgi:hypothetical protein
VDRLGEVARGVLERDDVLRLGALVGENLLERRDFDLRDGAAGDVVEADGQADVGDRQEVLDESALGRLDVGGRGGEQAVEARGARDRRLLERRFRAADAESGDERSSPRSPDP